MVLKAMMSACTIWDFRVMFSGPLNLSIVPFRAYIRADDGSGGNGALVSHSKIFF